MSHLLLTFFSFDHLPFPHLFSDIVTFGVADFSNVAVWGHMPMLVDSVKSIDPAVAGPLLRSVDCNLTQFALNFPKL
jgi:hypothetical protein